MPVNCQTVTSEAWSSQPALEQEQRVLQPLFDALPDQIYVKDTRSRFTLANAAVARAMGVASSAELIGKTDFDFFPRGLAEQFYAEEQALVHSGEALVNREARILDRQGRIRWDLTTKVPLRDTRGEITGLVGINRDITGRKQAEEELHQLNSDLARSQIELLAVHENLRSVNQELQTTQMQLIEAAKAESIARLAAGVAHEVKNPLAILLMGLGYVEEAIPAKDSTMTMALAEMRDAVQRADAIVHELLDYSTPRSLEMTAEHVNNLVASSLRLVRHELGKKSLTVVQSLAEGLPAVQADRIRIEQVLVNLLMNAIHASPLGGSLTVRTSASPGRVMVEVLDAGAGIPAEKLPKVFEPFFTTKPAGQGTGMGLAVAKQILKLHGGEVNLANRPEGGVRASVTLKT